MKNNTLGHAILWATLLIAFAINFRHSEKFASFFAILVAFSVTSLTMRSRQSCKRSSGEPS